jgi:hypothetical protein
VSSLSDARSDFYADTTPQAPAGRSPPSRRPQDRSGTGARTNIPKGSLSVPRAVGQPGAAYLQGACNSLHQPGGASLGGATCNSVTRHGPGLGAVTGWPLQHGSGTRETGSIRALSLHWPAHSTGFSSPHPPCQTYQRPVWPGQGPSIPCIIRAAGRVGRAPGAHSHVDPAGQAGMLLKIFYRFFLGVATKSGNEGWRAPP